MLAGLHGLCESLILFGNVDNVEMHNNISVLDDDVYCSTCVCSYFQVDVDPVSHVGLFFMKSTKKGQSIIDPFRF